MGKFTYTLQTILMCLGILVAIPIAFLISVGLIIFDAVREFLSLEDHYSM